MIEEKVAMKKIVLNMLILFMFPNLYGQKEELYKLNSNLIHAVESNNSLHLNYEIILLGAGYSPIADTMRNHFYKKSKDVFRMDLGDLQTVLRHKTSMLKVDYVDKLMIYGVDTIDSSVNFELLDQLNSLIDSAQTIDKIRNKKFTVFTLKFSKTFSFSEIQLTYTSATNLLKSMIAYFNQFEGQPYKSMQVKYEEWDFNWKDNQHEIELNKFIEKVNGSYQPSATFNNYKLVSSNK